MKTIIIQFAIALLIPSLFLLVVDAYAKQTIPLISYSPHDREAGRDIFLRRCARCHNNLEQSPFVKIGPNLHDLARQERVVDGKKMSTPEYVLQSIVDPDAYRVPGFGMMPKNITSDLTERQMRDLVAYLSGPSFDRQVAALSIPKQDAVERPAFMSRAEAEMAENVFRAKGQCLACHSIYQTPEYNALAPNLLQSGYRDIDYLDKAIREPSTDVIQKYRMIQVQLAIGQIVTGRQIYSSDDDTIRLLSTDAKGNVVRHDILKSEIEEEDGELAISTIDISPMPNGLDKQLTAEEIRAVCRMIITLNE